MLYEFNLVSARGPGRRFTHGAERLSGCVITAGCSYRARSADMIALEGVRHNCESAAEQWGSVLLAKAAAAVCG